MYVLLGFLFAVSAELAVDGHSRGLLLGFATGMLCMLCLARGSRFGLWLATVRGDETLSQWQRRMPPGGR